MAWSGSLPTLYNRGKQTKSQVSTLTHIFRYRGTTSTTPQVSLGSTYFQLVCKKLLNRLYQLLSPALVFDLVSAYGTVGLSLGNPTVSNYDFEIDINLPQHPFLRKTTRLPVLSSRYLNSFSV